MDAEGFLDHLRVKGKALEGIVGEGWKIITEDG